MNYNNILPYNLKFQILIKHKNKKYIDKYKKKIINIDNLKIDYINLNNNNINNIIEKKLDQVDIFVFSDNNSKPHFKINFYPQFPLIIVNKFIILTSLMFQIINGFNPNCKSLDDYMIDTIYRSKYFFGGIITNEYVDYFKIFSNKLIGYKNKLKGLENYYFVNKIHKNRCKFFDNNGHGWISSDTYDNLIYVLKTFKPKNIVEIGSWLGKSSGIIKENAPSSTLYCIDDFQPVLFTPYDYKSYTPLDNFYLTYPRLETFMKNMSNYENVYTIKYNGNDGPQFLKNNNIEVDMFFIDFEKNTERLFKLLTIINKLYPSAIIVGDDMVFNSVKTAISIFLLENNLFTGILSDSYIISSKKLINYYNIIKKSYKIKIEIEYIKKSINKNKIYDKNIPLFLKYCIEEGKFKLAFECIKNKKVNLNIPIEELENNNTYYHFICKFINLFKKKNI